MRQTMRYIHTHNTGATSLSPFSLYLWTIKAYDKVTLILRNLWYYEKNNYGITEKKKLRYYGKKRRY